MDQPSRRRDDDDAGNAESAAPRRETLIEGLAGFVRDEMIDSVVNAASGGWLSYDGADDDEEEPAKQQPASDDFNTRLERALAEMRANGDTAPGTAPAPPSSPATSLAPAPRPAAQAAAAPRGFGRKGL